MPERMCIICKKRNEKQNLFRFSSVDGRYLYDKEQKIQSRGFYLCDNPVCVNALSKHKKVKVEIDELIKILNVLKKKNKGILDILKSMRGSENLVYGMEDNLEAIKRGRVKLVVVPADIKKNHMIELETLCERHKVRIITTGKKEDLENIFERNLNIVGITNKRAVEGIMKKLEVTNEST
jgi:predicted RNA-binding protein YlxR (DUF448 family)